MSMYKRNIPKPPVGVTEFEILKASHKFLRDEDEAEPQSEQSHALTTSNADDNNTIDAKIPNKSDNRSSWNDRLAAKYYASLYREFALCDLKHYKSGNFALRWRTEDEVLSGAGETTCGNTRCEHHVPPSLSSSSRLTSKVRLSTLELPFGYIEHGKSKSALVKVVLCARCLKKLMWKRNQEKEKETQCDGDDIPLNVQHEGDEKREKETRREEGADNKRDRERPGKSKRKREEDTLLEEEKHFSLRRSRSQLREDQSKRHNHDSSLGFPINRREKNEISDRVGKRQRSRSDSNSRIRTTAFITEPIHPFPVPKYE